MSIYIRALLAALFCASFGFLGALGGAAMAGDSLTGDAGATGPAGPVGPRGEAGPMGPPGPAAPDNSSEVEALAASIADLQIQVDDLQGRTQPAVDAAPSCDSVSRVVTDVEIRDFGLGPELNVSHSPFLVCLTIP